MFSRKGDTNTFLFPVAIGSIVLLELAVDATAVFLLFKSLTLVVLLLASGNVDVELGTTILVNEKEDWHDAEAGGLDRRLHLAYLLAVEQELAVATLHVVVVGALLVLGNIHVLYPYFATDDVAIGINEARFSLADALYLRTSQDNACGIFVQEQVVKLCPLVLDVYVFPLVGYQCLGHL